MHGRNLIVDLRDSFAELEGSWPGMDQRNIYELVAQLTHQWSNRGCVTIPGGWEPDYDRLYTVSTPAVPSRAYFARLHDYVSEQLMRLGLFELSGKFSHIATGQRGKYAIVLTWAPDDED